MALIKCAECHKEISDKAKQCPYCGCPQHSNKPTKAIRLIVAICVILLIAGGYTYYRHEQAQIDEAIVAHNNYLSQLASNQSCPPQIASNQSCPQKPQSYNDLEKISQQYRPSNPGCRIALYDALHKDRQNLVPFKETKIYIDWDNVYKYNFEKLY